MAQRTVKQQLAHALNEVAQHHPDWRYGQVVTNVAAWAGTDAPGDVWNVSDEDLLALRSNTFASMRPAVPRRNPLIQMLRQS